MGGKYAVSMGVQCNCSELHQMAGFAYTVEDSGEAGPVMRAYVCACVRVCVCVCVCVPRQKLLVHSNETLSKEGY
jgi:hypothetical protein